MAFCSNDLEPTERDNFVMLRSRLGFGHLQRLSELLRRGLVGIDLLLLEIRMDAVDAKVDVEFEFELADELFVIMEDLGCLSEELLSVPLVEQLQDVILIQLAFQLRLV